MKIKILVTTTRYENYGDKDSPIWKNKGEFDFTILMDADLYSYGRNIEAALSIMVDKHSTDFEIFKYQYCKPIINEPHILGTESELIEIMEELYRE